MLELLDESGLRLDFMKYPEENSVCSNNFEACLPHKLKRFPIPMTAELFSVPIRPLILPAPEPLVITAAMLQQKDPPLGPADSRHLLKRRNWIWERAGSERRYHRVKARIGKRKRLCVRKNERNLLR